MVIQHAFLLSARRIGLVALVGAGLALGSGFAGPDSLAARAQSEFDEPAIDTPDVDDDILEDGRPEFDAREIAKIDPAVPMPATPRVPSTKGALVFHGNYCGPGNRGAGLPPVDALDEACMHHDACSPPFGKGLPSCGCNARLTREAALIARRRDTPDDIRVAAGFVAEGVKALACR